jgi:hypothetical protein
VIPYEIILTSASRPHLLKETLRTLMSGVTQRPTRLLIHNDEVFPDREREMLDIIEYYGQRVTVRYVNCKPPRRLGPALQWLLSQVTTEYVLYSQDDHVTLRPLPIHRALGVMERYGLNQIRFNKRVTMDKKGEFVKRETTYDDGNVPPVTLCTADHWYFQTGLWRVAPIRDVVDWWTKHGPGIFAEHSEAKINDALNGGMRAHGYPGLIDPERWNFPAARAETVKTFIWGSVGEPPFIQHIGTDEKDWALKRRRDN